MSSRLRDGLQRELRRKRPRGGAIVNRPSIGGPIGDPGLAAGHGTAHGVIGMTQRAAPEKAPRGVRLNPVCPGTIDTPPGGRMIEARPEAIVAIMRQQPSTRPGRPEEVAAAALRPCGDAAGFAPGIALPGDGGDTAT